MARETFTDYPLWKEAAALADSVFDFSRNIEDFSLRNRMTLAGVEIPFLIGEAFQAPSDEERKSGLWKVEEPINELRGVLTEAKEQGFGPGADFELMQERCRNLYRKVHLEASEEPGKTEAPREESTAPVEAGGATQPRPPARSAAPTNEEPPEIDDSAII
jgi:four helix bundle protein